MKTFSYARPDSSSSAVGEMTEHKDASYLGGGTALVDLMKEGVSEPSRLIDVTHIGNDAIKDRGESLWLGGAASNTKVAYDSAVQRSFPALSAAILSGASAQLRNRATVAGNLMQRTRCAYFRGEEYACNKRRPGSGCAALEGHNRYHAVLGTSPECIAAHPSDMGVALALSDATVHLMGAKGERELAFLKLNKEPGSTPWIEHARAPDELITSLSFKKEPILLNSAYLKLRDRASYAFALVSVAAAARFKGATVEDCRVALGGVGTVPWRATRIEERLRGQKLTEALVKEAVEAEFADAVLREDNRFKPPLVGKAVWRVLGNLQRGVKTS